MDKIDHIIGMTRSYHHMPALLSFLVGMLVINNSVRTEGDEEAALGDNVPTTLIEGIGR